MNSSPIPLILVFDVLTFYLVTIALLKRITVVADLRVSHITLLIFLNISIKVISAAQLYSDSWVGQVPSEYFKDEEKAIQRGWVAVATTY